MDEFLEISKPIKVQGNSWAVFIKSEAEKLGLNCGDEVIVYILCPEDELQMDMLIEKKGNKFYLLFSENPDLIVTHTLIET